MKLSITRRQAYKKWLAALRSGHYVQTQDGFLKSFASMSGEEHPVRYCCLGVVCEVAIIPNILIKTLSWISSSPAATIFNAYAIQGARPGWLSQEILSFLAMTVKEHEHLIGLNDKCSASFEHIADYIETNIMPKALKRPLNYRVRGYRQTYGQ